MRSLFLILFLVVALLVGCTTSPESTVPLPTATPESTPESVNRYRALPHPVPQDLLRMFNYPTEVGHVRVFSNISVAFSHEHAVHANLVWNYFERLFARSVGSRTEMYYTMDQNLYMQVSKFCQSTIPFGGRQVTTCYDSEEGIYRWFIVPYTVPDFGTQQHELSHSFLYATYLASEDWCTRNPVCSASSIG